MRFIYNYKTSENEVREGVIDASSRDGVYSALKKNGIRPYRVSLAPGLFNRLRAIGKRGYVIIALGVVVLLLSWLLFVRTNHMSRGGGVGRIMDVLDVSTRRQPIGDAAVIEKGIREGWKDVFAGDGDRFLASFAIPGEPAAIRNVDLAELDRALKQNIVPVDSDSMETRQIKAMVQGLKEELRSFMAAGGSMVQYGRLLVQRQEDEQSYYKRVKNELEAATKSGMSDEELEKLWKTKNKELRQLGIRHIPIPEG